MTKMYKVLYLDAHRQEALSGSVRADDGERWDSLVEALNDLSSVGFEVHTPIYGPAPKAAGSGPVIEAFLLASTSATPSSDLERRIKRTKALLAESEAHLATLARETERRVQELRVRTLRAELQELEQRLPTTRNAAESTDSPGSARAAELARTAERAFERKDFDEALRALKGLHRLTQPGGED
jgi:hypothetical protein